MNPPSHLRVLLQAFPADLVPWIENAKSGLFRRLIIVVIVGAGLYGAVMGLWRHPLQAVYTGIKLPLVILLTTLGNALLNGMLAPLLGLNFSFRQSSAVILMTFAIAATLLGALAPVAAFVVWNSPPLTSATDLSSAHYGFLQLILVVFIAGCGAAGNLALLPTLRHQCREAGIARCVLVAWLATNLLLGSQISWVLRPFIWDPARPVEFLGPEHWRGSFYETVFEAARHLIRSP